jgi:hypothetical protein
MINLGRVWISPSMEVIYCEHHGKFAINFTKQLDESDAYAAMFFSGYIRVNGDAVEARLSSFNINAVKEFLIQNIDKSFYFDFGRRLVGEYKASEMLEILENL